MTNLAPFLRVDITSPRFKADAHGFYANLRTTSPVSRVRLRPDGDAYLVVRYSDVSALLRDPRLVKDPANAMDAASLARIRRPPALFAPLTRNLLALDDPDHVRLRRLVQSTFTPKRVELLTEQTRAISAELLDRLRERDNFDLLSDYATPLPIAVISDLLGVPKRDQRRFARWSGALIRAGSAGFAALFALPEIIAFMRYLRRLIAIKRVEPGDDLVSALVEAEASGDRLTNDELLAMVSILLSAGHETTQNLIANGMLALLLNPDQRAWLVAKPEEIDVAIEELLRFAGPAETSTHRYAREDVEIAGTLVPRGALVFGLIASANRDEEQFPGAATLNLVRQPNRHLTFGEGGHYCVGAALARMEARVAFPDLLLRFPTLRLAVAPDALRWNRGLVLRGLRRLPLAM